MEVVVVAESLAAVLEEFRPAVVAASAAATGSVVVALSAAVSDSPEAWLPDSLSLEESAPAVSLMLDRSISWPSHFF